MYPDCLTRLQGIFTPLLVPLDDRGQINEPELRRFVCWLIDRGVHGLYPNGSTGEFTRFTPEERRRIVEIVADAAGGRVPILAGAAEANVKETLAAGDAYAEMGARAVAIVAPFYYKLTPESVYAYFAEIARNAPIMDSTGDLAVHDAVDRHGSAAAERFFLPYRVGGRAGPNVDDRMRRRHSRIQQRGAGSHPALVRPLGCR